MSHFTINATRGCRIYTIMIRALNHHGVHPMYSRWLLFFALIFSTGAAHAGLEFRNAWSPEAPPGRTMAGFMEIENTGNNVVSLVDGSSPQFGRIEIHDMVNDDGVMRMRKLDRMDIDPSSKRELKPGSFHLMLMEPKGTLVPGDTIELVLEDATGGKYPVSLEVRAR